MTLLFNQVSSREQPARCRLFEILLPLRTAPIADLALGDYKRSFLPRLSQSFSFFVRSCLFDTEENSANCGFMSMDHDGHLSLYQPSDFSFSFSSRQTAAPRPSRCSFCIRIDEPISTPGSESSPEIASRVSRCRIIAERDFPIFRDRKLNRLSRTAIEFLRDRETNVELKCDCFRVGVRFAYNPIAIYNRRKSGN